MARRFVWVIALVVILAAQPVSGQDDPAAGSSLLRLLAYVPDTPQNRNWIAYGDSAAWHTAWGVPRVDSLEAVNALDEQQRNQWMYLLTMQATPPEVMAVQYLFAEAEDQRATYGFNFFDLERGLEAGAPPDRLSLLELAVEPETIGTALAATGYASGPLGAAGTLYSLREDYALDAAFPLTSGKLPMRNRIGLLDRVVVVGSATAVVDSAAQAAAGELPTLADDPVYRAAVGVVESDPTLAQTGPLIGAILLPPAMLAGDAGTPRPAFQLAAFATRHTLPAQEAAPEPGGATSLVLALVLDAGADAEAEAQGLADRLAGYVSQRTHAPLNEQWTALDAFATEAEGLPVAVVVLRIDDPVPAADGIPVVNRFGWVMLIQTRDVGFLAEE